MNYEGLTKKYAEKSKWIKMDGSSFDLSTKVICNPGFAPYNPKLYGENGKYHNYSGLTPKFGQNLN